MDFTKLNLEFANMQTTITKYHKLQSEIKERIKNDLKSIGKYETKLKNTKNTLEKEVYKIVIVTLKNEMDFLNKLLEEEKENNGESRNAKIL